MGRLHTITYAIQNWLHLKCKLLNKHDYVLEKKYTEDLLKLHCKKCRKKFAVNLKSAIIFAWDEDLMSSLLVYKENLKKDTHLKQSPNPVVPMKIVV